MKWNNKNIHDKEKNEEESEEEVREWIFKKKSIPLSFYFIFSSLLIHIKKLLLSNVQQCIKLI
jgi:hypothetical protein